MCEGIGPAVRSGIRAAEAILGRNEFVLDDVDPFTSGNRLVSGFLDRAFNGERMKATG
jgi:hypothetical protein